MRRQLIQSFSEDELCMLFYIVNVLHPTGLPAEVTYSDLPHFNIERLKWKISQCAAQVSEEGKPVFESLMMKNNRIPQDEAYDYANETTIVESDFSI